MSDGSRVPSIENERNNKLLVSFILLLYKHEYYVKEAIKGAMEQEYSNVEFIISDDNSPDSTFLLAQEELKKYQDNKSIFLNRNETNMGLVPHFNKLLKIAKGDIIVVAAGDDISLPKRVSSTVKLLEDPEVAFVSFNEQKIDEKGNTISNGARVRYEGVKLFSLEEYISGKKIPFSGASRGFRRKIYDDYGDLNQDCPTEDTPYIIRGLLTGKAAISSEIAIKYREHGENLSGPKYLPYMNISHITNQYVSDLNIAFKKGLVDKVLNEKLESWISTNNTRRVNSNLRKQLSDNNFTFSFLLKNILFDRHFSVKEQGILLIKCTLKKLYIRRNYS
ncbi:glycosyltransferase family 2 protein [Colwellia sp. C1TZA3]|uniref:glycosyltransferase family 2 protein n=1 Tax=Colwellia sp. C1TZA3 TaxID=2508879 RepID=UPI0011BA39CE|nr:glycosyltransferase [Colwellia sp. C1TZA3]TWX67638.1 glycosyltransferase [Colwellia sp. C1TZA3]